MVTQTRAQPRKTSGKTKPSKAHSAIRQGIFEAGDAAVGLASLREGFGRTPEDDRLFALGWPHLVYLVEGDATPQALEGKTFSSTYPFREGEVAVGVAPRMLRHVFMLRKGDRKKWLTAIRDASPLSEDEAKKLAKAAITEQMGTILVYLLEALRSSSWVLDRVLRAYEDAAPKWHKVEGLEAFGDRALRALPFVMLRVTKGEAAAARKRLRAIAATLAKGKVNEFDRAYAFLRLVLDPKRHATELWHLAMLAPKDATFVRERAVKYLSAMEEGDCADPDLRLAFVGGDAVTKLYMKHANQLDGRQRSILATQLARVRTASSRPSTADVA